MKATLLNRVQRYTMALFFLIIVIVLMMAATLGVEKFGNTLLHNTDVTMKPHGEKIDL
jgi:hypothetical protein